MNWSPSQLYFGADYNPEQWPKKSWPDDIKAMQDLGVNMVTLGVFSWSLLEPREGVFEFGWLDEIVGLLHEGGIRIDMATATASTPAWLTEKYPSVAAVNRDGVRLSHGGRQHYSPSSQVYRDKSLQLVEQMASRYAAHPALEMWHVNNELGCHTPHCYGDEAAQRFRLWLEAKYETVESLNHAWRTQFWSQRYGSFGEINPPRTTALGTFPNPGQWHDYMHFSSDQLLELFIAERDVIRRFDSTHPITTNFMSMRHISAMDYWKWAKEVDFVSTDHYAEADNDTAHIELAFQADLTRGLAGGQPWLLMEHSPAAVNWQPRNRPKDSAETVRHAMSHIARGSQGVMFFQFKQSQGGSERFHSAMVPHVGTKSRVYRTMASLGQSVSHLDGLAGQITTPAQVAIVFDYQSWWALQQPNLPSIDLDYAALAHDWYGSLYHQGIRVDFIDPDAPVETWAQYPLVLAPMLHVVGESRLQTIDEFVSHGGVFLTSFFSGVADQNLAVHLGGYGGELIQKVCGVRVEEFVPLAAEEVVDLSNGWRSRVWSESATAITAETVATYHSSGIAQGGVALSRNPHGDGEAWYLGTALTASGLAELITDLCARAGVVADSLASSEVIARGPHTAVINHSENAVSWRNTLVNPGDVEWFTEQ